jgi:pimeloyl-ACP methyl ester carboxylesterase
MDERTPRHTPFVLEVGSCQVPGRLYQPAGPASRTVQVLVHGLTYDRRYWTLPGGYNYVEFMTRAGYAVAVFDRVGTGESTRPPAEQVTTDLHVRVLHEIVRGLRDGSLTGRPFDKVVVVGHSYGSGIGIIEAARHQDVDGLIVSGMLHAFTDMHHEAIDYFRPAAADPLLGPTAPPPGYLTQRPGFRAKMLEYAGNIDPLMSAHNELIKSTGALGEGNTLAQTYLPSYSLAVNAPVLLVVGEHDALFCGKDVAHGKDPDAVHRHEQSFYSAAARLRTYVIPAAGHSLNLHYNARTWFAIARDWIDHQAPPRARSVVARAAESPR